MNISPHSVTGRFYFHWKCATIKIEVDNIKLPDIKLMTSFWGDLCWNAASSNGHGWYCNSGVFSKEAGWVGQFSSDWKHCHPLFHMGWRGGWRESSLQLWGGSGMLLFLLLWVWLFLKLASFSETLLSCVFLKMHILFYMYEYLPAFIYVYHMHTVPTKARRWHAIFCCWE